MLVVVFANEKGGVGKTTTTANFASVSAASGLRVLAVDMDPQANLTFSLGHAPETLEKTVADLISPALREDRAPFDHVVIEGEVNDAGGRLDVLPINGHPGEVLERDLSVNLALGMNLLREALRKVEDRYDIVAIDTPPRLNSPLLMVSLIAANGVVGVMEAQVLPMRGSHKFAEMVQQVMNNEMGRDVRFLGLLLNMYEDGEEARTVDLILEQNGLPVLNTRIPKSKMASKVLLEGHPPVSVHRPDLRISAAYREMTEEILELLAGQEA